MPTDWPVGSLVVLLNSAVQQFELPFSARGLARHYRIGAAARGYDDPATVHRIEAFLGIGLRPYAPVHLRWSEVAGNLVVRWVRRSRIDGDSWQSHEVPLGEDRETYLVRVIAGGAVMREATVAVSEWVYAASDRASDAIFGIYSIEVAQISDRFGPGPFRVLDLLA